MAQKFNVTPVAAMTTLGHMTPHGQFLGRWLNVREAAERRYIGLKNDSVRNMPRSGARADPAEICLTPNRSEQQTAKSGAKEKRKSTYSNRHFFFFNDTATTEIYTLSLHDALPI